MTTVRGTVTLDTRNDARRLVRIAKRIGVSATVCRKDKNGEYDVLWAVAESESAKCFCCEFFLHDASMPFMHNTAFDPTLRCANTDCSCYGMSFQEQVAIKLKTILWSDTRCA